jgi:hypothetical protein
MRAAFPVNLIDLIILTVLGEEYKHNVIPASSSRHASAPKYSEIWQW